MAIDERIRALASDARAGRYARGAIRRAQRDFIRRQWRFLGAAGGGIALCSVIAALLAQNDLERGLLLGSGLATATAVVTHYVTVLTGSGPRGMGEVAEQWTAQELRPLMDHDWRLVNHVSLDEYGDLDHVLVGPGGLLVIETKWSATRWRLDPPDSTARAAVAALIRRSGQLGRVLKKQLAGASVTPLIVLWGQAAEQIRDDVAPTSLPGSDARVIAGLRLREWLLRRGRATLTPEQVQAIWRELDRYAGYTDAREDPLPASFSDLISGLLLSVGSGLTVFLGIAELARAPHGWLVALVSALLLLIGALGLRQRGVSSATHRSLLTGVAAGAGIGVAVWLTAVIWTVVAGGRLS